MYCRHCGKKIEEDSHFCPYCGSSTRSAESEKSDPANAQNAEADRYASAAPEDPFGGVGAKNTGGAGNPYAGQNTNYNNYGSYNRQAPPPPPPYYGASAEPAPSIGWGVLGFFFPIVGLILFLVWHDDYPKRAKMCGKGALISVIVWVVFFVLWIIFAVVIVAVAGASSASAALLLI